MMNKIFKTTSIALALILFLSFSACRKPAESVDLSWAFSEQNWAFGISPFLPRGSSLEIYYGYEHVNEPMLIAYLYGYNLLEDKNLKLSDIEEYLSEEYEEDGTVRTYLHFVTTRHKEIRSFIYWLQRDSYYTMHSADNLRTAFKQATIYVNRNNLIANMPNSYYKCTVQQAEALFPYVSSFFQNIAFFAKFDENDIDFRLGYSSLPEDSTIRFEYYTFANVIPEALEIALGEYTAITGEILTFEEIEEFMSVQYEEDGSLRYFNNGKHLKILKYVKAVNIYMNVQTILKTVFPPEPEADSFSGSAVSV